MSTILKKKTFQKFVPLLKVDEIRREVSGIVTEEKPDKDNEICLYEPTKPYYQKWSDELRKATNGLSCGNLREMHQLSAVGAGKLIEFDDAAKQIRMTFKVVDDGAWKKVTEGVYSGFSQGGSYVSQKKGPDGAIRFVAKPTEVSLVDSPCLPTATFEFVRADGTSEMRKFANSALAIENEMEKGGPGSGRHAGSGPGWESKKEVDEKQRQLADRASEKAERLSSDVDRNSTPEAHDRASDAHYAAAQEHARLGTVEGDKAVQYHNRMSDMHSKQSARMQSLFRHADQPTDLEKDVTTEGISTDTNLNFRQAGDPAIESEEHECPFCGRAMLLENGVLICPDCDEEDDNVEKGGPGSGPRPHGGRSKKLTAPQKHSAEALKQSENTKSNAARRASVRAHTLSMHAKTAEDHYRAAMVHQHASELHDRAGNEPAALQHETAADAHLNEEYQLRTGEKFPGYNRISETTDLEKIHHPHKVKEKDKWKVVDDDGHVYGTHDNEDDANQQLAALYAAKGREEKKSIISQLNKSDIISSAFEKGYTQVSPLPSDVWTAKEARASGLKIPDDTEFVEIRPYKKYSPDQFRSNEGKWSLTPEYYESESNYHHQAAVDALLAGEYDVADAHEIISQNYEEHTNDLSPELTDEDLDLSNQPATMQQVDKLLMECGLLK